MDRGRRCGLGLQSVPRFLPAKRKYRRSLREPVCGHAWAWLAGGLRFKKDMGESPRGPGFAQDLASTARDRAVCTGLSGCVESYGRSLAGAGLLFIRV